MDAKMLAELLRRPRPFDMEATSNNLRRQAMVDGAPVGSVGAPGGISFSQPAPAPLQFEDAMGALSFAPVFGDVAGLMGDAAMYASKPETRTPGLYALSAMGLLPFVPAATVGEKMAEALRKIDQYARPASVTAPHGVRDKEKFNSLLNDMRNNGWNGRPILGFDVGRGIEALTGSHRIAAAKAAGLEDIPVQLLDQSISNYQDDVGRTIHDAAYLDPDELLDWLKQFGDQDAVHLLMKEP